MSGRSSQISIKNHLKVNKNSIPKYDQPSQQMRSSMSIKKIDQMQLIQENPYVDNRKSLGSLKVKEIANPNYSDRKNKRIVEGELMRSCANKFPSISSARESLLSVRLS